MIFKLSRTSDRFNGDDNTIEINTLEQLINIVEIEDISSTGIILKKVRKYKDTPEEMPIYEIEIYDDYRE